jgi:hypothetical protein
MGAGAAREALPQIRAAYASAAFTLAVETGPGPSGLTSTWAILPCSSMTTMPRLPAGMGARLGSGVKSPSLSKNAPLSCRREARISDC